MKLVKFGGTSVGSPQGMLAVRNIVAQTQGQCIVVVSAIAGMTDLLIALSHQAAAGDDNYRTAAQQRHHDIIAQVVPAASADDTRQQVDALFDELASILHGVRLIADLTPKTADAIVAYGERISSIIVAAMLHTPERPARHLDARDIICTNPKADNPNSHVVDFTATNARIQEALATDHPLTVVGGFIARDLNTRRTTNLGRGGSDYTAAIIAAQLRAERLEIWTDVDGILTADPRVVPTAVTIPELTYAEATELCNFGAKVIYAPTIYPAHAHIIPIVVRNTFNPDGPHTVVSHTAAKSTRMIRGISSIADTAVVTVHGLSMVGVIGVNRRIFASLATAGISVFMVAQSASETSTSLAVTPADAERACDILNAEFAAEIASGAMQPALCQHEVATVAVVGENLRYQTGTVGKLFSVLGRNGVGVSTVAIGDLEMSVSFVVPRHQMAKAISVLHDSIFLGDHETLHLFLCGTGTVGARLLDQLASQRHLLRSERGLQLHLVGVSGRSTSIFHREGIDPATARQALAQSAEPGGIDHMVERILAMNLPNSVFVDCTASAEVTAAYQRLIDHNVSVVTANKLAASGPYAAYRQLKESARDRGVKVLYETNGGAGLPIINTIGDLLASGDRVVSIEAVLSGTLNYVFNTLSSTTPLSEAVRLAKENGYAEPDPRIDLSGMDVVRKITILARESGYAVDTDQIEKHLFLPPEMFEGTVDEFWQRLPQLDAQFEAERQRLHAEGKRWRFVAEWRDGRGSVGLKEIAQGHPLYNLEGSNNIVCLTTERYDAPMLIQGYGAGADVTAAGVFADIMRAK